jgi:hypothetical protein
MLFTAEFKLFTIFRMMEASIGLSVKSDQRSPKVAHRHSLSSHKQWVNFSKTD